jgi:hypothetical protein
VEDAVDGFATEAEFKLKAPVRSVPSDPADGGNATS